MSVLRFIDNLKLPISIIVGVKVVEKGLQKVYK